MDIVIIHQKITLTQARELALNNYGEMVKGVVDLQRSIIAFGGDLHADAEAILLKNGSLQTDLWGFNLYPDRPREQRIVFGSLINIRPKQGNRSIEIQDPTLKEKIRTIVDSLVE